MVRFSLLNHDDDEDDDDVGGISPAVSKEPAWAMIEHAATVPEEEEQHNAPVGHQFEDSSSALPAEAPAFIVAYQQNGTPFLVTFNPPNKERRRTSWTFWIVLIAIGTQIVLWYGPPAPPSDVDESWAEFFERETSVLTKAALALISIIPHVGQWCMQAIHADVTELLQPSPCPLEIPNDLSSLLKTSIVGQPLAVSIATQALQAWNSSEEDQKALVLVLAGTVGVGKLQLARQVAQAITCPNAVLELLGRTFDHRHDFTEHLLQHIDTKRVVILQHPEDMAPLLLTKALEQVASTPNLILIMTTHVGSRVIHSHLREQHQAEEQPSSATLARLLRQEFNTELDPGVSEYITTVAPFVPLGREDLEQIIMQKVANHLTVNDGKAEMTSALAKVWTSSKYIEYFDWQSKGRTILTFSSRGAKVLDEDIWQTLVGQQQRCQQQLTDSSADGKLMEFDFDDGEAVVSLCDEDTCEEECRFAL